MKRKKTIITIIGMKDNLCDNIINWRFKIGACFQILRTRGVVVPRPRLLVGGVLLAGSELMAGYCTDAPMMAMLKGAMIWSAIVDSADFFYTKY